MMTMGKRNFISVALAESEKQARSVCFSANRPKEGCMADSTFWWSAAGIAVAVELATGTFYLLMFAIGLAAGALAAHAGAAQPAQFFVAAVVGGGAVTALRLQRRRNPKALTAGTDPDVNPDIGET